MNTILKINLKNCYGIKKLEHEFEFTKSDKTFSIYAQNGSMKTSLAKTFDNVSKGDLPKDLVFTDRESTAVIEFDNNPISEEILVIDSYKADYKSEKISTLLVNKDLQKKYKSVHQEIDTHKEIILQGLKKISGISNLDEIEKEISKTFYNNDEGKFFESFERIKSEINGDVDQYSDIKYKDVFDPKVMAFLSNGDVQDSIKNYVEQYENLLDDSTYFRKGIFNHSQAEDTASNLSKNGFFKASHAVLFGGDTISTEEELIAVIESEKEQILGDQKLRKIFDDLDRKITKNQSLKDLRDLLTEKKFIIAELSNLENFKAKLWKHYLHELKSDFNNLLQVYGNGKEKIKEIIEQAKVEETDWFNVIQIFNERFIVPFSITISNKMESIVKSEAPSISFDFIEGNEKQSVEQNKLLDILSQGEKRALYLLNIIFEIEARKKAGGKHIFLIDDIADSFDYKNKYAIIEYLRDMSNTSGFYQIILSHNFDFHRTVSQRLGMKQKNKLGVIKINEVINLEKETSHQNNPFNYWRKNLDDDCFLVAAIPFVRNLAEYTGNKEVYDKLTQFIHIKEGHDELKIETLKGLFSQVLKNTDDINKINGGDDKKYSELLENALSGQPTSLEAKITKSIAIRLKGERFIISNLNDKDFVGSIKSNQTAKLISEYKKRFSSNKGAIKTLDKIQLMTPESIHINSFMYEPLLDMSNEYLDDLYAEILILLQEQDENKEISVN